MLEALGELDPDQAAKVRQHGDQCAECQQMLGQHVQLLNRVQNMPVPDLSELGWQRLDARFWEKWEQRTPKGFLKVLRAWFLEFNLRLQPSLALACLTAIFFLPALLITPLPHVSQNFNTLTIGEELANQLEMLPGQWPIDNPVIRYPSAISLEDVSDEAITAYLENYGYLSDDDVTVIDSNGGGLDAY